MATLAELQRLKAQYEAEIKRRKGNAPNFTAKLNDVNKQIAEAQSGGNEATQQKFNPASYLAANPDIAAEANRLRAAGDTRSIEQIAEAHWASNGQAEGRKGAFGNDLADEINTDGSGLTETDAAAINRAKGVIQVGEDFGRRIGEEFYADGALGRAKQELTPDEIAAMAAINDYIASLNAPSNAVTGITNDQRNILNNAQELSPLELEALNIARGALPGLNAPEMEALRSQARGNIAGQAQADARALAKAQARNQVFGAAATAQNRLLNQDRVKETRNLERDLLVKNIDIQQAARNAFTGLTTATEANRAGRTNAASAQLSNTVLTDEGQRQNARGNANAQRNDLSTSLGDRLRALEQFNLNQAAAERAGRIGSIFGGIGTISNERGLLAGENFADKQYADSQAVQDRIFELMDKYFNKQNKALS